MSKLEYVDISLIDLDIDNPRIAKFVEFHREVTEDHIKLALQQTSSGDGTSTGNSSTYQSLRESIRTQKGLIHPIIIVRKGADRFLVIEGNTRLSIYKDFNEQGIDGDWQKIPSIVHESLPPQQVEAIRLQAHLVGPRDWEPYAKAKYLNYLRNCEHLTLNQIIDFCGGKKQEVHNYIDAYNDMEQHYRPVLDSDDQFDMSRFSAFVELQRPAVKEAILVSGHTLEDFSCWVHRGLLSPLNTVRSLKLILGNVRSREIFLRQGAKEALKIFDQSPAPDLANYSIEQLTRVLYEKLSHLTYSEIKEMRNTPEGERARLFYDLRDEIVDLCNEITKEN